MKEGHFHTVNLNCNRKKPSEETREFFFNNASKITIDLKKLLQNYCVEEYNFEGNWDLGHVSFTSRVF